MPAPLQGLHHVTMVVADARRTVDFYTRVLGLRLVKLTVNFDLPDTYHLYFGDDEATPGTVLTAFEWPEPERLGAPRRGILGAGLAHHVALGVRDADVQRMWKRWLTQQGVRASGPYDRQAFRSLYFQDPDGIILELATLGPGYGAMEERPSAEALRRGHATQADDWPDPVPELTPAMRPVGLHHVTAVTRDMERTAAFYTELLGLSLVKAGVNFDDPDTPHYHFGDPAGRPGTVLTFFGCPDAGPGAIGPGVTHHVAFMVPDDEAQAAWREHLLAHGLEVTPVKDRKYFRSIYFRDPDGLRIEIATRGPGFAVDEAPEALGARLQLPAHPEPRRKAIAAGLRPLREAFGAPVFGRMSRSPQETNAGTDWPLRTDTWGWTPVRYGGDIPSWSRSGSAASGAPGRLRGR